MWRFVPILVIVGIVNSAVRSIGNSDIRFKRATSCLTAPISPSSYNLDLTVTEDSLINGNFAGKVTIDFSIVGYMECFALNARNLDIENVTLTTAKEGAVFFSYEGPNAADNFLRINILYTTLYFDNITLTVDYNGVLSDDMEGFYRKSYTDDDGTKRYFAVTQFAPRGASSAFPCFEDSTLKAIFQISLTYSEGYSVLSNTPVKEEDNEATLKKVVFGQTPKMRIQSLALMVSQYKCLKCDSYIEIYGREFLENTAVFVQNASLGVIDFIKDYTNIDYGNLGLTKLTEVAVPNILPDSTGNWGLITFREWDPDQSSSLYRRKAIGLIAHSLAHQWFGNLVTLTDPNQNFLTEGFATYVRYYATFDSDKSNFIIDCLQPILLRDSLNSALPIVASREDPSDYTPHYKGAALFRMVESILGSENFKKGLIDFFAQWFELSIDELDLWDCFDKYINKESINTPFFVIMANWIGYIGYPLLNVTLSDDGDSVTISQVSFRTSVSSSWIVPITYTTSGIKNFKNTDTQKWLNPYDPSTDRSLTIPLNGAEWIILNNQQVGYYRVHYDNKLLQKISRALNDDYNSVDEISRSHLIDDQFNLARANYKTYGDFLRFVSFLKNDDSYYSWSSAFNGFSYLLKHTVDQEIRKNLTNFLKDHLEALSKTYSLEINTEEQSHAPNEVLGLSWACYLEYGSCLENATAIFGEYKDQGQRIDPDYASIVFCSGLRNSDDSSSNFNFLWDKYVSSKSSFEQLTILESLGCTSNSSLRNEYLKKALTDDVKKEDIQVVFSSVYSNNPEGPDEILDFLKNNHEEFTAHFGDSSPLISLINNVVEFFTTQSQIDKLNNFIKTENVDPTVKDAGNEAIAIATANLNEIENVEKKLKTYFENPEGNNDDNNNDNNNDDDDDDNDDDGDDDNNDNNNNKPGSETSLYASHILNSALFVITLLISHCY